MKGCCYVMLQVFIVLLGLAAVACFVFCCMRRLWLEAAIAGVIALLCIHVCILQAERKHLGEQMQQATLVREEAAKTRGLELAEEGIAGPPAQGSPPVQSSAQAMSDHDNACGKEHVQAVCDQHDALGKVLDDAHQQKDLDKVMLNALAKEYLRCNAALQDYRKRYGPLDSKDSDCNATRMNECRMLGERFAMDPSSDVSMQKIGELKSMAGDFSKAVPATKHTFASQADVLASAVNQDKLMDNRPPAALIGHVPDMIDQQVKSGWVGDVGAGGGTGGGDTGAGVFQLLPPSPRVGPPQRSPQVRRRQPGGQPGQSRRPPPSVSLVARDHGRLNDNRPGPALV